MILFISINLASDVQVCTHFKTRGKVLLSLNENRRGFQYVAGFSREKIVCCFVMYADDNVGDDSNAS